MQPARIVRIPDHLVDGIEEWDRRTDDDDVRAVSASRAWLPGDSAWTWRVGVAAAEHVRVEPLEAQLRQAVVLAIRSVAGVVDVADQDRELWIVSGDPSGEALVSAVGEAVDELAAEIRAHLLEDSADN